MFWKAPGCNRQKYNLRREVHVPKKPFSSVMRYIVSWRNWWLYRINANIKTRYP